MTKIPDLEKLYLFQQVVEAGSFNEVCRSHHIPKPTLSRKIRQLEEEIGHQLLIRSTRGIRPTERGLYLYQKAKTLLDLSNEIYQEFDGESQEPQGSLRISAGVEFGLAVLNSILVDFQRLYPKIHLDVELTGRFVDLIHENVDVAIRIGSLADTSLHAEKLGEFHSKLFASPQFVEKYGSGLITVEDLRHVPTLEHKTSQAVVWKWTLFHSGNQEGKSGRKVEIPINPVLHCNNRWLLIHSCLAHQGIMLCPDFLLKDYLEQGTLIPLFNEWSTAVTPIHAVYPEQTDLPVATRVFIDFVAKKIQAWLETT